MNFGRNAVRVLGMLALGALAARVGAQSPDYAELKAGAEKSYAEGSYARAREAYQRAAKMELPAAEARWARFRVLDAGWRADSASKPDDEGPLEEIRAGLEAFAAEAKRIADRDETWAESRESLGDFWWMRPNSRNWQPGWPAYQEALDWWAGSPDLEKARARYLRIVFKAVAPPWAEAGAPYGAYGNYAPLEVIENVVKLAATDDDRARAHYMLAMTLRQQGSYEQMRRVPQEFEAALAVPGRTDWRDDAIFNYAQWMENQGKLVMREDGQWSQAPDYAKALDLYRKLLSENRKGGTRYYDQARAQIELITAPTLDLSISNVFLPGSEVQCDLNWRNLGGIDFAVYGIDLLKDVNLVEGSGDPRAWVRTIPLAGREKVKSWSKAIQNKEDHQPGSEQLRLEGKLEPGVYVVEAKGGGKEARDLILVTDAALVLKTSGTRAVAYACGAEDGAPLAGAAVLLWEGNWDGNRVKWRKWAGTTNADGIANFELSKDPRRNEVFAAFGLGGRQAFASVGSYYQPWSSAGGNWRIHAFTDRPAYRPEDTVEWKFVARLDDGQVYSTPEGRVIEHEITDPRGAKIAEGKSTLNAFGSAWGSLALTKEMPLGEYRVQFYDEGRKTGIGGATLFRLEEYKLPEFKVSVSTPEENGRKKTYRLGDNIEAEIAAEYTFGGPVVGADVEILVHQNPFYHRPRPKREFPWLYQDIDPSANYGGSQGPIIKRETVKTDAGGKARITLESPIGSGQELEYRIEARVVDASRREVTGADSVRVARQRYYVDLDPGHVIYKPKEMVVAAVSARDANEQAISAEGKIKVTRETWDEVWIDPAGNEVKGDSLAKLRAPGRVFPPPGSGATPWRLAFQGYRREDIVEQTVKTDAEGAAEFAFKPDREGYYRIAWTAPEPDASPIRAETAVWVAEKDTKDLGYHGEGGLRIFADKDTFRVGQKAPVMLVAPTNGRFALLSVEAGELMDVQLVRMEGSVKLVEIDVAEKHVPNFFLTGAMVSGLQMSLETKQIVVPPTKNFLNVELTADRAEYRPREEGTLTVRATDDAGKPVRAEIALGLSDESVLQIQGDYAGDPRQFFYGTKRGNAARTSSSFNYRGYVRVIEEKEAGFADARDANGLRAMREESDDKDRGDFSLNEKKNLAKKAMGGGGSARLDAGAMGRSAAKQEMALDAVGSTNAPAAPMAAMAAEAVAGGKADGNADGGPVVVTRSDFRATAFWKPDVVTGDDGAAQIKVTYPDSLTGWRGVARAASATNQFGQATVATRTRQPLIARLQSPRFFVVGDLATVSAVINNNTGEPMRVQTSLEADGLTVSGLTIGGRPVKGEAGEIDVPANGEARADWMVSAGKAGEAKLKVVGKTKEYADAMEKTYEVYEHGVEKFISRSGKLRSDSATVKIAIPKERRAGSEALTVRVAPSLAATMLDSLPYLIDYPYGCVEQTMSRFLPAAIVAKTIKDLGVDPGAAMDKAFGGIEPSTAAKTHPKGKKGLEQLGDVTKGGLDRLYEFQHGDGGWAWWREGESDPFMTAYVVWGMALARGAGVEIRGGSLERGAEFLDQKLVEAENAPDMQAWMLHALSAANSAAGGARVSDFQTKAVENLWTRKDRLNAYTRALFAIAAHNFGLTEKARILAENLENGIRIDNAPDASVVIGGGGAGDSTVMGTAHWGEDGLWWRWSEGGVEATAFALRALIAINPQSKLIEPTVNWLVKNRRGAQWSNTRDTAIALLALSDYLKVSGELKADVAYEVTVNGKSVAVGKATGADALEAPSRFAVDSKLLRNGENEIKIARKSGEGAIYFAAEAVFFSMEEPIPAAGNEIFVRREYFKTVGRPTLLKGWVYDRVPLRDGESVASGERVEAVITVEAKNNYEYLIFEDLKPAGLEAAAVKSGESMTARRLSNKAAGKGVAAGDPTDYADGDNNSVSVYQELRDRKAAMFISKLPEGKWEMRYELRAETPGRFHALPVMGQAMYVPEVRCNGAEERIEVKERAE